MYTKETPEALLTAPALAFPEAEPFFAWMTGAAAEQVRSRCGAGAGAERRK